jgi:hypothetical protein
VVMRALPQPAMPAASVTMIAMVLGDRRWFMGFSG